jgi:hypothetical protein
MQLIVFIILGATERTPRFGCGVAGGGGGVEQWGVCRYTAMFMPFSVHTMAWSGEHRAFVVEELIENVPFAVNKQNFRYWSHNNP